MSLWAQEHQQSVHWAVYHKFGEVFVEFGQDGPRGRMSPESAIHMGEQLIRWAKEAKATPPTSGTGAGSQ